MMDDLELEPEKLVVFTSGLGWMSLRMRGQTVGELSFGHPSAAAAIRAIAHGQVANAPVRDVVVGWAERAPTRRVGQRVPPKGMSDWQNEVVQRLQRYAEGVPVDFCDLSVDSGNVTGFQARVLKACREIPYGKTITYGELAARARSPGAGRAVGSCMSGNRVPLIIPCHRVVRSGGQIGLYSAPGGSAMKRRLLKMEIKFSAYLDKCRSLRLDY